MSYLDIYNLVKMDKIVIVCSYYGNVTTYFKNKMGKIKRKFNDCIDDDFYCESSTEIEKIYKIYILNKSKFKNL